MRSPIARTLSAVAAATFSTALFAQAYPSKPIRMIVPFPPGGTMDPLVRLVGGEMSKALGQPIVVDNRPGAGTVIGVEAGAKAPPDGYTFVVVAPSFTANATLVPKLPYDSLKDLQPVGMLAITPNVLAANPSVQANSLKELVDFLKKNPAKLTYASFGNGTAPHLAGEQFKKAAGIFMLHIPYKGLAPAMTDLIAGHVDLMFGNLSEYLPQIRAGKLKAYGVTYLKRSNYAPEIPTIAEQGYPGFETYSWFGVLAPAGVPKEIVERVNREINASMNHPDTRDQILKRGLDPLPGSPEKFGETLRSEIAKYAKLIKDAGIKMD
jgi:tripartite-type tricarboxylate transporter receptor subunit TctC